MKEEEKIALLEEAKRRYPVGTIFNSCGGNKGVKIRDKTTFKWNYVHIETIGASISGSVYYDGKWAIIIDTPIAVPTILTYATY